MKGILKECSPLAAATAKDVRSLLEKIIKLQVLIQIKIVFILISEFSYLKYIDIRLTYHGIV